jgi:hypothetical protein
MAECGVGGAALQGELSWYACGAKDGGVGAVMLGRLSALLLALAVLLALVLLGCKRKPPTPKPPVMHPGYYMLNNIATDTMLENALAEAGLEDGAPSDPVEAGAKIPVYFCGENHWMGQLVVWNTATAWTAYDPKEQDWPRLFADEKRYSCAVLKRLLTQYPFNYDLIFTAKPIRGKP